MGMVRSETTESCTPPKNSAIFMERVLQNRSTMAISSPAQAVSLPGKSRRASSQNALHRLTSRPLSSSAARCTLSSTLSVFSPVTYSAGVASPSPAEPSSAVMATWMARETSVRLLAVSKTTFCGISTILASMDLMVGIGRLTSPLAAPLRTPQYSMLSCGMPPAPGDGCSMSAGGPGFEG